MHTRRVPVAMYVVTLLVVPAIVVVGFMSAGLWATTGSTTLTTTQTGTSSGKNITGAAAPASPQDVKGSMTVQQVAPLDAPLDTPPSTQLKTLAESGSGVDIPALRSWLQEETAP